MDAKKCDICGVFYDPTSHLDGAGELVAVEVGGETLALVGFYKRSGQDPFENQPPPMISVGPFQMPAPARKPVTGIDLCRGCGESLARETGRRLVEGRAVYGPDAQELMSGKDSEATAGAFREEDE